MPRLEKVTKSFHQAVQADFNELMLGELLGTGLSREVYVNRMNPRQVVKLEQDGFQNVTEHLIWSAVCDTPWAPWFARCHWISPNGRVLIQERGFLPKKAPPMPELVPSFVTDARECNLGVIRGRWALCDYGFTGLLEAGLNNFRWVERTESPEVERPKVIFREWELP